MIVGTLAYLLVAAAAVTLTATPLILVGLLVVLAVVVALVSSTHADVVILMAVVAVLGVTPHQDHRLGVTSIAAGRTSPALSTLVAIGDSYMSGEGASVYYAGTDDGGGNQCRRAPTAWASLAADSGYQAMDFLACSGARTGNVVYPAADPLPTDPASRLFAGALAQRHIITPQGDGDGLSQLVRWQQDQARRHLVPALVVVSLGGNDGGFSTIGQMCLAPGSCAEKADLWNSALAQVRDQLRLTYTEIDETFPDVPVLTVGYPDPIYLADKECTQVTLRPDERQFVHDFLTGKPGQNGLNDVIAQTSAEFGFHYVDTMEDSLTGQNLQLCDPANDDRPGLNFIGLRSVRGAAEQRFNPTNWLHSSLHPNERGHAAMLRAFQTWLAQHTANEALPARRSVNPDDAQQLTQARTHWSSQAQTTAQNAVNSAPPCDLFAQDSTGCRPKGSTWALGQVRHTLLTGGLWLALLAAFAAWTLAIGFFASRRIAWAGR
jgi:lysophospholipase L1-like esterase